MPYPGKDEDYFFLETKKYFIKFFYIFSTINSLQSKLIDEQTCLKEEESIISDAKKLLINSPKAQTFTINGKTYTRNQVENDLKYRITKKESLLFHVTTTREVLKKQKENIEIALINFIKGIQDASKKYPKISLKKFNSNEDMLKFFYDIETDLC